MTLHESNALKSNFHQIRLRSVKAVKRFYLFVLPQTIETILVIVGYSTGYGRGTAQNRPQTGTMLTILASSIFEGCWLAALSQNTSTANQFALIMNIHELTSTPIQFTNRVILYSLSMVSIANQWHLAYG